MKNSFVRASADRRQLEVIDARTGITTSTRHAAATKIVQLFPLGENVVIREDYYQFPRNSSNVYCVDGALNTVWMAELPHPTDVFANSVIQAEGVLRCITWDGYTCDIDVNTGKLLKRSFTK